MDSTIQELMNAYYDERAEEYELVYQGQGPASINNPRLYRENASRVQAIVGSRIHGKVLDFACGTGYWIPFYLRRCEELTLLDQSRNMLRIARQKAAAWVPVQAIQADIYEAALPARHFDSILASSIFSHIEPEREIQMVEKLLDSLRSAGSLIVVDSSWSASRKEAVPRKDGYQKRRLENGKEFMIYKRYFEADDFINLGTRVRHKVEVLFEGEVAIAAQIGNA